MIAFSPDQKEAYLTEVRSSALLLGDSGTPEGIRIKVLHAIDLQSRRLAEDRERFGS
jgi:hypothetical protein